MGALPFNATAPAMSASRPVFLDYSQEQIDKAYDQSFWALQMAERVLSGESGSLADAPDGVARVVTTDRKHDCVPEVSAAGLPSAIASSVTFTLSPNKPQ